MLNAEQIQELLPHRGDMLLVERVVDWEQDQRIVAELDVTERAFWVEGHFPGRPLMPGVLIAEAVAQAAALLLLMGVSGHAGGSMYLVGLDRYRVRRPVVPGETLRLDVQLVRKRKRFCSFDGTAWVGQELVAEGHWLAAMGQEEER
jgi:3-hydroxyacyl-[acyl-carrier-protein] dehydratase